MHNLISGHMDLEELKSIEHDYIGIFYVSVFQAMGISTAGKAWDWIYYSHLQYLRVQTLLEVTFFAVFVLL